MKRVIKNIFVFAALVLLGGCVHAGAPVSTIGTPKFVPQSQPDSLVESGIGQDPNTGGMFLQWYSVLGAAEYKVYRSDSVAPNGMPVDFADIGNVSSSSSLNDTSMVDASARIDVKYFYYLKAFASDGSWSGPSDTISYLLLWRDYTVSPKEGEVVTDTSVYFHWTDNTGGGYTVVRVMDITAVPSEIIWVSRRFQNFHFSGAIEFDFDSRAILQMVTGHTYKWRVDRFNVDSKGTPYEGSRSAWATFTFQ